MDAEQAPTVRPDGDVTLIQFFDYQCIWCSRMAPVVEAVMDKDASLRVAFREYPILVSAGRFPAKPLSAGEHLAATGS